MAVPVRNIYYLLCYAWNRLEARELVDVGAVSGNRIENLLGSVLSHAVADLIRRGLDRGYVPFEEEGRRLRGKMLLSEVVKRTLLARGRVVCTVDELSHDVPHNRLIKAAMAALVGLPGLDQELRVTLRSLGHRMGTVADTDLSPAAFRHVQLHRNVVRYAFVVNLCSLIARSFLPDEKNGGKRFQPFTASEQEMGLLFQAFVRNFLKREQDLFQVSGRSVPWDVDPADEGDSAWLPQMLVDVMLTSSDRRVVVETKYYATPYREHYGTRKLISGHLYQLLTYLSQLRATPGPAPVGVLLYAGAGELPRLDYRLGGHRLLVRSVDLNRDWPDIHRGLIGLAHELGQREVMTLGYRTAPGGTEAEV